MVRRVETTEKPREIIEMFALPRLFSFWSFSYSFMFLRTEVLKVKGRSKLYSINIEVINNFLKIFLVKYLGNTSILMRKHHPTMGKNYMANRDDGRVDLQRRLSSTMSSCWSRSNWSAFFKPVMTIRILIAFS